jgi:hypothetical protein
LISKKGFSSKENKKTLILVKIKGTISLQFTNGALKAQILVIE